MTLSHLCLQVLTHLSYRPSTADLLRDETTGEVLHKKLKVCTPKNRIYLFVLLEELRSLTLNCFHVCLVKG